MSRFDFRYLLLVPALMAAGLAAACSDNNTNTVTPTPPVAVSETFAGSVTINGAFSHSFDVARAGSVTAELVGLSPDDSVTVGLALGTWNGTACQLVIANDAAKLASTVLGTATAPGTLCVRVSDVGQLAAPTDYEVEVTHY